MNVPAARRIFVALGVGAALAASLPAPVTAATTVAIAGASRSGPVLAVTGQAVFGDQPFVSLGTDPAGDQLGPGTDVLGRDVTGFSMSSSPGGTLTLRWNLGQLPPGLNRGVDVGYGKAFCVTPSEEPNCWVVIFADVAGAPLTNSFVQGWECSDETCAVQAGDWIHTWETDRYDVATKTALATIPFTDLGISSGSELTAAASATFQGSPVFVTTPWWFLFVNPYPVWDATAIGASYSVPTKDVSLAVGPPGQAPDQVEYPVPAAVDDANRFSGELDVSALAPGPYTVYARACFGAGNCGYATRDVTL